MRIPVQVILTNALEHSCALAGELHLVGGVVHRWEGSGAVDTEAWQTTLPQAVAEALALDGFDKAVFVEILGRDIVSEVHIGGNEVVLSRYTPDRLDLKVVDGELVPRHPEGPVYFIPTVFTR
jgi:hypothetical protein